MRQLRLLVLGLIGFGAAAVAAGACSASGDPKSSDGGGSPGGTAGGGTAGHGGDGGSSFVGSGTSGTGVGGGCGVHCSSDLHSLVDCAGNVLETCPPDQGCSPDGCVPACESAQANKSTIGCDYYTFPPDVISEAHGACFAAFVANTWGSPVSIGVERDGQTFDASQFARIPSGSGQSLTYSPLPNGQLPPGEVAILFLARWGGILTNCPAGITPAFTAADAAAHGTTKGDAFRIVTSAPVVAYDIFPYGGGVRAATSATLLLPATAWDTNYVAVDAFRKSQVVPQAQPSIAFVAAEDNTTVTINPVVAIEGGAGVPGTPAGVPASYVIQRGEILQFTQNAELIGSVVQSDKPIGAWAAATCLNIDVTAVACDSAHQQIPPVKALGSEYVAVRYRNRYDGQEENVPWRLVGAVDGTSLTYDPAPPAGAPPSLARGQVAEFRSTGLFSVRSQDAEHPFYMSAHMTGASEAGGGIEGRGDPEFVNVIPPQQYLTSYVFFTDPTYPETNLVLVRAKGQNGFEDVELDCAGNLTGWQPIGSSDLYEYTRFDLVTGNFQGQGACDNGRHEIKSNAPFGLTIWGWGSAQTSLFTQYVSYAYPAGASIQPINQVVVPTIPE